MADTLRWLLLGIVLVNLAFVQLTESVGPIWMAGLWSLCAVAPLLLRWHDRLAYRMAWNALVLAAFTWLMGHVTTTGLLHMLEDGLLLAALCQVHLLNNVGRRQRPDLLFFNSFLITFVTSFFSNDLGWSLCFCAYAALLVPALQLFAATPRDGAPLAADAVRALLRDSLPRTLKAIAVTAVVFVLWPRDFRHEGWLGDTLQLSSPQLVAFAEEIRLDRNSAPTLDDRLVMRIRPTPSTTVATPSHWRGVTFVRFDGNGWQTYRARDFLTRRATDRMWNATSRTEWHRELAPGDAPFGEFDVEVLDLEPSRLFTPLEACRVTLDDRHRGVMLDPKADGVVALDPLARVGDGLLCTVAVGPLPHMSPDELSPRARGLLCQLPTRLPLHLQSLRREIGAPTQAGPAAVATHYGDWLRGNRRYALPGADGAARNLGEFLLGAGGGHCEYFATTLALLLRIERIPCRVVGGYLAHERDAATGHIVARRRDAHAWVEVLLPDRGWTTFDATPEVAREREEQAPSGLAALWQRLEQLWRSVTGFDAEGRRHLLGWLLDLPSRLLTAAREHPLRAAGLVAAVYWLCRRWRRRRERGSAAVLELEQALRRARLAARPGETPRELLARDEVGALDPDRRQALVAAVQRHERERYRR